MNQNSLIYLDNNATTRVDPAVVQAMMPYWSESYLNPSSVAGEMFGASSPLLEAKEALASLLGGEPEEFVLTSGATEANNWVFQSIIAEALRDTGKCHIIISAIEHPSIMETAQTLAEWHPLLTVDFLPVDQHGVICVEALKQLVTGETSLVSIMLANNETGVIQPVAEAVQIVKKLNPTCVFHTDATQAVGKIPVDLNEEFALVDLLSLSGHKFHGPKGIGSLFVRSSVPLNPWMHGGAQQGGRRAGTENPATAAGLAAAIKRIGSNGEMLSRASAIRALRDQFESSITNSIPAIRVLCKRAPRLPNTSLLLFPEVEGELLVYTLLEQGVVASTGAACKHGSDQPSYVVTAMGVSFSQARNVVRLSLSGNTSVTELDHVVAKLTGCMKW
jgi:cysteine desulfurase